MERLGKCQVCGHASVVRRDASCPNCNSLDPHGLAAARAEDRASNRRRSVILGVGIIVVAVLVAAYNGALMELVRLFYRL